MLPGQIPALWAYLKERTRARGGWDEAGSAVEKANPDSDLCRVGHCRRSHHRLLK